MGTPNKEPQEYSIIEYQEPGKYIPIIIFLLYFWGSLFGVPVRILLCSKPGTQEISQRMKPFSGRNM